MPELPGLPMGGSVPHGTMLHQSQQPPPSNMPPPAFPQPAPYGAVGSHLPPPVYGAMPPPLGHASVHGHMPPPYGAPAYGPTAAYGGMPPFDQSAQNLQASDVASICREDHSLMLGMHILPVLGREHYTSVHSLQLEVNLMLF